MIVNEQSGVNYPFIHQVTRGSYTTVATMPVGAVCIVDNAGTIQTSSIASSTSKYRVCKMTANGPVFSPEFTYSSINSKVGKYFEQAAEQVSFVGYNGSSGSISTPAAGDTFKLSLELLNTQGVYNNSAIIKDAAYTAQAATQVDVATGITNALINEFKSPRAASGTLMFGRTSDGTGAALNGSATIYKLTQGSTTVYTYIKATAANVTLTALTASVNASDVISIPGVTGRTFTFGCLDAVGHVIYIADASVYIADQATAADGSDNATALAAAINLSTNAISKYATASATGATVTVTYRPDFYALPPVVLSNVAASPATVAVTIASGNSVPTKYLAAATTSAAATFELDIPWQGATGYVYEGTTLASNIAYVASPSNWGVKIVGLPEANFNPKIGNYMKVRFKTAFKNLTKNTATSTITENSVVAKEGTGMWQEASVVENNGGFKRGKIHVSAYPPTVYAQEVESYVKANNYSPASMKYDSLIFTFYNEQTPVATTGHVIKQPITITIYSLSSLAYDELETVLAITPVS